MFMDSNCCTLRRNCCTFSFQAFFDLFWVGKQPSFFDLNVPIRGPNQRGWFLSSLPRSGIVKAQATLIRRFECSLSSAQLKWLAPFKPSSIWLPEQARNLDPALWRSRFEDPISMVGSFQAFLILASWTGRQPWSCAFNVPFRGPNQRGWLLPSLPRSCILDGQAILIL